ncbi:MAG: class I SAM-dependent methyltransferase [Planctomycetes bacterium]|nr:class I SAM-dependent methyltransferase [Planctomycetota bacterium]
MDSVIADIRPASIGRAGISHVARARSVFEELFLKLAENYVGAFPAHSFDFVFDGREIPRIGTSAHAIRVRIARSKEVFRRICLEGSLGLGETYCEGLIDVADRDYKEFLHIFVRTIYNNRNLLFRPNVLVRHIPIVLSRFVRTKLMVNPFRKRDQAGDINSHYSLDEWFADEDAANEFFLSWLHSPYPQYSCAHWDESTPDLESAQRNKFERFARHLGLDRAAGDKSLLDLGCGWGGWILWVNDRTGLPCTGITLARSQARHIHREISLREDPRVRVLTQNVHDMEGAYDYITSFDMLEHIDDYDSLIRRTHECLKPGGVALFQAGFDDDRIRKLDPFLEKYIFPGATIPNIDRIARIFRRHFPGVEVVPLGKFDYAKTIDAWYARFCRNQERIASILATKSGVRDVEFSLRVFKHYLALSSAALGAKKGARAHYIVARKGT